MSAGPWLPIKLQGGGFSVARNTRSGDLEYAIDTDGKRVSFTTRQRARRCAESRNVGDLPGRCSDAQLQDLLAGVHITARMRRGVHLLLVEQQTWAAAARTAGVTESGLLRCLRRVANKQIVEAR